MPFSLALTPTIMYPVISDSAVLCFTQIVQHYQHSSGNIPEFLWRFRCVFQWVKALSGSWGSGAVGHEGHERETSTAQHIKETALTFMFWSIELKWSSTAPWITARKHSARPDNSGSGPFLKITMTLNTKNTSTFMRRFYVTGLNV